MQVRNTRRRQTGFTLLELVVVVAVLVTLAGFVLPKLDFFMLKANKGIAASNMSGTSRFIQQFRVVNNVYPDYWDSMFLSAGGTGEPTTLWQTGDPGTGIEGIDPQLTGGSRASTGTEPASVGGLPVGGPHKMFTSTIQNDNYAYSLSRMGIYHLMDADPAFDTNGKLPGDQFDVVRAATLHTGSAVAILNGADDDNVSVLSHYYPGYQNYDSTTGLITDYRGVVKQLIVLGLGPRNQIVGQVLQSCPTYANTDHTQYYDHLLVLFEGYPDGTRGNMVGVIGGDADLMTDEVGDYYLKQ